MIHASSLKFISPDIRPRSSRLSIQIFTGVIQNKASVDGARPRAQMKVQAGGVNEIRGRSSLEVVCRRHHRIGAPRDVVHQVVVNGRTRVRESEVD